LLNPNTDFPPVVDLLNRIEAEPTTVEDMRGEEARMVPGKIGRRWVVEQQGQIVGYALSVHYPSRGPGQFHLHVVVDQAQRNQGMGMALYGRALDFAKANGAIHLTAEVQERCPEGLAFALRHGFAVKLHEVGASLDLSSYDETPLLLARSRLVPHIQISTYAVEGDTLENRRKLYTINRIATTDDPGTTGTFPEFAIWQRLIPNASDFQPHGQFVAIDTRIPERPYIGLSGVAYLEGQQGAQTLLTGVRGEYRGKGVAQALKLEVARFAVAKGATRMLTRVHAANHPMLAINAKMGFVLEPGFYWLEQQL
jgi:GNAT superfamily N-acetyltransferase